MKDVVNNFLNSIFLYLKPVLVEKNCIFQLRPGDVILEVNSQPVNLLSTKEGKLYS